MSVEEIQNLVKEVDDGLFEIINHLICSICLELLNNPTTTPCGHTFCSGCIKRVLFSKNNIGCPLCKNPVKRYNLEPAKVKSTLSNICQELPSAFKKDVEDLTDGIMSSSEDFVKRSKLFQLGNQDCISDSKVSKKKPSRKSQANAKETDVDSFVPVVKRSKKVIEYCNTKKIKADDLVSISQTEAGINSSLCSPSDMDKKLEKIEKIPAEEKVKEWFDAVGDNIYLNSPTSSLVEAEHKKGSETEEQSSNRIRVDYVKKMSGLDNEKTNDPYEFIPSQNKKFLRKRKSKSSGKGHKIPQFKAIQMFTRESLKRNLINQEQETEQDNPDDYIDSPKSLRKTTASQKFDDLLMETKENEQKETLKVHTLYSSSQASSVKFLDCSFHSKIEPEQTPKRKSLLLDKEDSPKENLFTSYLASQGKKRRSKRKRSSELIFVEDKKKKLSVESCKTTKLMELLRELVGDNVIYCNSESSPIKVELEQEKNVKNSKELLPDDSVASQSSLLLGFSAEEESPDIQRFKKMVANMEEELEQEQNQMHDSVSPTKPSENRHKLSPKKTDVVPEVKVLLPLGENHSSNVVPFNLLGKIKKSKNSFIEFYQVGRLTPTKRRSRSSVVKLIFPIGLSSFAKRRSINEKVRKTISPTAASTAVQTFQHFKPVDDTPQEEPTGRKFTSEIEIQTSQTEIRFKSTEIQTSQVPYNFAEVQTTQICKKAAGNQTSQVWPEETKTTSQNIQTSLSDKMEHTQNIIEKKESMTTNATEEKCVTPAGSPSAEREGFISSRKSSVKHKKVYQQMNNCSEPSSPGIIDSCETPKKSSESLNNFELDNSWSRSSQKRHKSFGEVKNKNVNQDSDDSDVQVKKKGPIPRILSQDSGSSVEMNKIPPNEGKSPETDHQILIDLGSPKENSQDQMLRVLKNIDLDLKPKKVFESAKSEKSEESDSDFFVEQTPPKPRFSNSRWRDSSRLSQLPVHPNGNKLPEDGIDKNEVDSADLIGDSIPKALLESESFLMLSPPEKTVKTPKKSQTKSEAPKKSPKPSETFLKPFSPFGLPKSNENDQNQLNADVSKKKVEGRSSKRTELFPKKASSQKRKICVVASSVKNPELIKRFVTKFKLEYSNKLTKDMTHLIVGLHANEENELLPLCTPKVLFAMANKKWVVSESWPETCLKLNALLPEESFETVDPVGGSGCKNARLSSESLLDRCEVCLLGDFQTISKEEFASLIVDCGGTLVASPEKFSFSASKIRMIVADRDCLSISEDEVQGLYEKYSTVILSRDVIIMSIQSFKLSNFIPYLLHGATEEELVARGYPSALVRTEENGDEHEHDSNREKVM